MTTCDLCGELFNGLTGLCDLCSKENEEYDYKEDQDCPRCKGSGTIESMDYTDGDEECYRCQGKGFI